MVEGDGKQVLLGPGGFRTEAYERCHNWHEPVSYPTVAFGPDGTLYYLFHLDPVGCCGKGKLFITTSSDGGITFATPKLVDQNVRPIDTDYTHALTVDQRTGRVYVVWNRYCGDLTPECTDYRVLVSASDDRGQTFSAPVDADPGPQSSHFEVAAAVGPDGRLFVAWLDFSQWFASGGALPAQIYVTSSTDGGSTFPAPVVAGGLGVGCATVRAGNPNCDDLHYIFLQDSLAIAPGRLPGQLYLTFWDRLAPTSGSKNRVFFTASSDGGRTWASPRFFGVPLGGEGNDQHRPGVSVAPNGRLDIAYYNTAPDRSQDVYSIYSCDQGSTFSTPQRVTTASSNARIGSPPPYSGDVPPLGRIGVLAYESRVAAAWTDTRNGDTQSRRQDVFSGSLSAPSSCAGQLPGPDIGQRPSPPPPSGGGPGPDPGGGGGPTPIPGPVPGQRPGVAGSRCGDLTRPRSSVSKRSRLTRTRILLTGRTTDRACSPGGRVVRAARKLARVEVSVGAKTGRRCRFMTAKGTPSTPRTCARPMWLRATTVSFDAKKAKTSWKLVRAVKLPAGRYNVIVRGVDRDGNVEVKKRSSNRATLRVT